MSDIAYQWSDGEVEMDIPQKVYHDIYNAGVAAERQRVLGLLGEEEALPYGELKDGEINFSTKAHEYHMQRVFNRNDLRAQLRLQIEKGE